MPVFPAGHTIIQKCCCCVVIELISGERILLRFIAINTVGVVSSNNIADKLIAAAPKFDAVQRIVLKIAACDGVVIGITDQLKSAAV